jgi:hypothetical protein
MEVPFLAARESFPGSLLSTLYFLTPRGSPQRGLRTISNFWHRVMNADPPICRLKSRVNTEQDCSMRRGDGNQ